MRLIIIISLFLLFIQSALATNDTSVNDKVIQKEDVEEYPIIIQGNKATLKVVKYKLIAKENNQQDEILKKIELISDTNIIYANAFIPDNEKLNVVYNKEYNTFFFGNTRFIFLGYAIFNSDNVDYFAYSASTYPDLNPPHTYSVVRIMKKENSYHSKLLDGNIVLGINEFGNSKISEHLYKLLDNKYIIADMDDSFFHITLYHEIDNKQVKPANMEFNIIPRATAAVGIKRPDKITLYAKPDRKATSKDIAVTVTTQVKFIGIKYLSSTGEYPFNDETSMIHVIVDGQEGWIFEGVDVSALGVEPRNIGVW